LRFSAGAADSYARAVSASSGIVIVAFCIVLPHNYSTAKNRLSAEQKDYFKTEIRAAQLKFTELQWKLQDEMEKLVTVIKQPRVDEQQVLAQLEKVLAAEREIKRQQVTLLVRIKNKLTPEQQGKLSELRSKPPSK